MKNNHASNQKNSSSNRNAQGGNSSWTCPECQRKIPPADIRAHKRKHETQSKQNISACPKCGKKLSLGPLEVHMIACPGRFIAPKTHSPVTPMPPKEPKRVQTVSGKTGVFYEDHESCIVVYQGTFISTAINVKHGQEILARYISNLKKS